MKKLAILITLLAITISGCWIITGNVVIIYEIGDLLLQGTESFGYEHVDLSTESDWNDHKEQLKNIDDLGFLMRIENNLDASATGKLYISTTSYSTLADVLDNALLVLSGITVPANTTKTINLEESYGYLTNFLEAKAMVFEEQFYVYYTAPSYGTDVFCKDIVLVLSINAEP